MAGCWYRLFAQKGHLTVLKLTIVSESELSVDMIFGPEGTLYVSNRRSGPPSFPAPNPLIRLTRPKSVDLIGSQIILVLFN